MSAARDKYQHVRNKKLDDQHIMQIVREGDPLAFAAGAQYALDYLLATLGTMTVGPMYFEHSTAAIILEKVKKKDPL